jgi:hypothetical protein
MTARWLAPVFLCCVAATAAAQDPPASIGLDSPISIDRVRAGLAKAPSRLVLREPQPEVVAHFSIHIEERHLLADIFDKPLWATDPVGWQPPGYGFDLISAFRYVAKEVNAARRQRDERLSREEVQQSIREYCEAQPNRASISICLGVQ